MLGIFAPTPKIVNSKMELALLMSARGTKSHNEKGRRQYGQRPCLG
jgi:hypothetical protein